MFLLVPAYPGCPGQTVVKWLLLLFMLQSINTVHWTWCMDGTSDEGITNCQRWHDSIADLCWTVF